MNERTAKKLLSQVMGWGPEQAAEEFRWLGLISAVKYDSYRDYLAGHRFLESLVGWLLQFETADRKAAYGFVRHRLAFVSATEREHLLNIMYPRTVLPRLLKQVATARNIAPWQIHADATARADVKVARRRTLFLALSDGARLDSFRHANVGRISNEQVVNGTQLSIPKWADLHEKLKVDLRDKLNSNADATFTTIYLVDDFAGSGTSFVREKDGKWSGKLVRFMESYLSQKARPDAWTLVVHHLITTERAKAHLRESIDLAKETCEAEERWFSDFDVTWTHEFDVGFPLSKIDDAAFVDLTERYYDESIVTNALRVGGTDHVRLGYGGCALPLILDHNTPNNSIALLWARSDGEKGRAMRPLFYRRQRHVD